MFNIIETLFYISLAITFILIILLVYHFKQRIVSLEQKNDTMFEIINNVVKELNNIINTISLNKSKKEINNPNLNSTTGHVIQSQNNIIDITEEDEDEDNDTDEPDEVDEVDEVDDVDEVEVNVDVDEEGNESRLEYETKKIDLSFDTFPSSIQMMHQNESAQYAIINEMLMDMYTSRPSSEVKVIHINNDDNDNTNIFFGRHNEEEHDERVVEIESTSHLRVDLDDYSDMPPLIDVDEEEEPEEEEPEEDQEEIIDLTTNISQNDTTETKKEFLGNATEKNNYEKEKNYKKMNISHLKTLLQEKINSSKFTLTEISKMKKNDLINELIQLE